MSENKNNVENTEKMNKSPETTEHEDSSPEENTTNDVKNKKQSKKDKKETSSEMDTELTELQDKYAMLNDKYLRLYSEFDNFRRRTAKEKLETLNSGGADLVKELLPVIDDFDRAMVSNEIVNDPEALKEGFHLIYSKLLRILEQQGLAAMDSLEKPFDTECHDAITNIPAPSDDLKGKVVDVAEKGYYYKGKIIRHAKVVVGQ